MNDSTEALKPILVIVRGLPGSGKSYVVQELQSQMSDADFVVLDPDAIDFDSEAYAAFSAGLTADGVDAKLHPYRFLRSQGYAGIKEHKIIIWNQAFTHQDLLDRTIKNLQTYAVENGHELPALIVEVHVDPEIAKERVAQRVEKGGHDVSAEAFERFINDYKTFDGYGYQVISLDGTSDITESVTQVKTAIKKLLRAND